MDKLILILHEILHRIPWPSESDLQRVEQALRDLEADLGLSGNLPPAPGPMNAPSEPPPAPDPGPVAETETPADFVPPTSPEVAVSPETDNAFAQGDAATQGDAGA